MILQRKFLDKPKDRITGRNFKAVAGCSDGYQDILFSVADDVAVFLGNALYSACVNGSEIRNYKQ
jgi:hypothetical protein